jgi:4a-hydroxytetrahydrobiopterin dehydratase
MPNVKILTEQEIETALKKLPGWIHANNRLSKEFAFKDFLDGLSFVSRLAPYFENMDHHPDTHIFYKKVLFELTRYEADEKVSNIDIDAAQLIEQMYRNRGN